MGLFDFANSPEYKQFGSALQNLGQLSNKAVSDKNMLQFYANRPEIAAKFYGTQQGQAQTQTQQALAQAEIQKQQMEQQRQTALAQLFEQLQPQEDAPADSNLALLTKAAALDPERFGKSLISYRAGENNPSALKELAALDKMTPEQKANFWNIKRNQWQNAGGFLLNPQTGETIEKTLTPEALPSTRGAQENAILEQQLITRPKIEQATTAAKITGESQGAQGRKEVQAPAIDNLIKEARTILPQSTSGLAGQIFTGGARAAGVSTDASKADARLKVLSAALTSNVPRFEGPQGVLDVEIYKQAAADVANSSLPSADRLAALETMEKLNNQYLPNNKPANNQSAKDIPEGASLVGTANGKPVYKLPDGRGWTP